MGKTITILALAFVLGLGALAIAHGPGMSGRGYGWNCPGYGDHMGPGWGYGPWRSGPGYGREYGPGYQQPQRPMEEKDARAILDNYLQSMRNPNLKLGEIRDQGYAFEAEIVTKDNSLVDKILVDKNTGSMRSVY